MKVIEGFDTSPALEDVFTRVLKVPKSDIPKVTHIPGVGSTKRSDTKAKCGPTTGSGLPSASYDTSQSISPYTPKPFLKTLLRNEKEAVESLLRVAAKIGPVAQTAVQKERAYDAAFESKIPAPIPTYASTLQGFAFILLFWSYLALAIVITVYANGTTGSATVGAGTLIGFGVVGVLALALIQRYG